MSTEVEEPLTNPGVRFPPPLIFALGFGAAVLLHAWNPIPLLPTSDAIRPAGALLVLALGLFWIAWALLTFWRARTGIVPHHSASKLVTNGPYRFGRNPMYLGMSLIYWSATLWVDTLWAAALFPIVIIVLRRYVIRREEVYLTYEFGDAYLHYRSRVARWLGRSMRESR